MTAYDTVLDVTLRKGENNKEYSRDQYKKLAVYAENQVNFEMAVVIERVKDKDSREPLGYTRDDFKLGMYDATNQQVLWNPTAEKKVETSTNAGNGLITNNKLIEGVDLSQSTVNSNLTYMSVLGSDRFGYEIASFYRMMAEVEYIMAFIEIDSESNARYQEYRVEYNAFAESMNDEFTNLSLISKSLLGI